VGKFDGGYKISYACREGGYRIEPRRAFMIFKSDLFAAGVFVFFSHATLASDDNEHKRLLLAAVTVTENTSGGIRAGYYLSQTNDLAEQASNMPITPTARESWIEDRKAEILDRAKSSDDTMLRALLKDTLNDLTFHQVGEIVKSGTDKFFDQLNQETPSQLPIVNSNDVRGQLTEMLSGMNDVQNPRQKDYLIAAQLANIDPLKPLSFNEAFRLQAEKNELSERVQALQDEIDAALKAGKDIATLKEKQDEELALLKEITPPAWKLECHVQKRQSQGRPCDERRVRELERTV
jgi:hypothetical protein